MVKIALGIFFLISCRAVQTNYSSDRPMNRKFRLNIYDTDTMKNNIISNGIVYVRTEIIQMKNVETNQTELTEINSFLRFFKGGQFIYSSTKNFDTGIEDYNNLKKGVVGYYRIKKDIITMEKFYSSAHDYGRFHISTLKILEDSIEGYKKLKVEGLTGTPDW